MPPVSGGIHGNRLNHFNTVGTGYQIRRYKFLQLPFIKGMLTASTNWLQPIGITPDHRRSTLERIPLVPDLPSIHAEIGTGQTRLPRELT